MRKNIIGPESDSPYEDPMGLLWRILVFLPLRVRNTSQFL